MQESSFAEHLVLNASKWDERVKDETVAIVRTKKYLPGPTPMIIGGLDGGKTGGKGNKGGGKDPKKAAMVI